MSSGGFIEMVSAYSMTHDPSAEESVESPTPDELRDLLGRRARRLTGPAEETSSSDEEASDQR